MFALRWLLCPILLLSLVSSRQNAITDYNTACMCYNHCRFERELEVGVPAPQMTQYCNLIMTQLYMCYMCYICCRFERELEVGVPDPTAREDILRVRWAP
jgi:hypothetical protein